MPAFLPTHAELTHYLLGAGTTLCVAALSAVLGLAAGLLLLSMRHARWRALRWTAAVYVSFVRGTPSLVQIFLIYYALPGLLQIDLPAFAAGVLALSLNSGAFTVEILRGALAAIPKGQFEASQALGLSPVTTWRRIVLPQLLRHALPPLVNELTMLVKASALLSVITVVELTRAAQEIMNATYRPVEAFVTAGAIYFVMLFALASYARSLERRLRSRLA